MASFIGILARGLLVIIFIVFVTAAFSAIVINDKKDPETIPTVTPVVYRFPTKIVPTLTPTSVPKPTPTKIAQYPKITVSYDTSAPKVIRVGSVIYVSLKIRNDSNTVLRGFQIKTGGSWDSLNTEVVEKGVVFEKGIAGMYRSFVSTETLEPGASGSVTLIISPREPGDHRIDFHFDGYDVVGSNTLSFRIYTFGAVK